MSTSGTTSTPTSTVSTKRMYCVLINDSAVYFSTPREAGDRFYGVLDSVRLSEKLGVVWSEEFKVELAMLGGSRVFHMIDEFAFGGLPVGKAIAALDVSRRPANLN